MMYEARVCLSEDKDTVKSTLLREFYEGFEVCMLGWLWLPSAQNDLSVSVK